MGGCAAEGWGEAVSLLEDGRSEGVGSWVAWRLEGRETWPGKSSTCVELYCMQGANYNGCTDEVGSY